MNHSTPKNPTVSNVDTAQGKDTKPLSVAGIINFDSVNGIELRMYYVS